jgi:N-acetylglucosamine-6-phosphate deacetylase
MPTTYALRHAAIFTGDSLLHDHTLLIENGHIAALLPDAAATRLPDTTFDLRGKIIAPGLIDLQVYGGGGALFSSHPTLATLENLYRHTRSHATVGFLATLPTNAPALMTQAIEAAFSFQKKYPDALFGLHLEGPFLHPDKRGAHPGEYIQSADIQAVESWLSQAVGVLRILTIAPECCSDEVLALGKKHGVIFSAGHSNATYAEAMRGFDEGCDMATHLFNAMSPLGSRVPGLVGAIFDHPTVRASVIADGVHVDFAALRIAKKIMGSRLLLITDAVDDSGEGVYRFFKKEDHFVNADEVLGGSALTMPQAVFNCVRAGVCDLEEALRMASRYPAEVWGVADRYGSIAVGYLAELAVVDVTNWSMSPLELA